MYVSVYIREYVYGTCATGSPSQENRRVAARSSPQRAGGETLAPTGGHCPDLSAGCTAATPGCSCIATPPPFLRSFLFELAA